MPFYCKFKRLKHALDLQFPSHIASDQHFCAGLHLRPAVFRRRSLLRLGRNVRRQGRANIVTTAPRTHPSFLATVTRPANVKTIGPCLWRAPACDIAARFVYQTLDLTRPMPSHRQLSKRAIIAFVRLALVLFNQALRFVPAVILKRPSVFGCSPRHPLPPYPKAVSF